jgi:hypothetical protein
MSSSIFDSYRSYEYYPKTLYSKGDKKFEEVDKGDILYYVSSNGDVEEIISNGRIKKNKHHLVLSTSRNGKRLVLNFGPLNVANVYYSYKNSIMSFEMGYIGTNKKSVVKKLIEDEDKKFKKLFTEISNIQTHLAKLNILNR